MVETETTPITPFEVVRPLVTTQQAVEQWRLFEELKQSLLKDDDYATIQGKPYVKKSGFRKIAVFFGLSDSIISEDRVDRENGTFFWRIKVESRAPNGRTSIGVGICDSQERGFSHVEHDVYATAHTRAKNRAISDMVAGGLVSAEEMDPGPPKMPSHPKNASVKVKNKPNEKEDHVFSTLEANGLHTEGVRIFQYGNSIWIQNLTDMSDETWDKYNTTLRRINGKWKPEQNRWEIPV